MIVAFALAIIGAVVFGGLALAARVELHPHPHAGAHASTR